MDVSSTAYIYIFEHSEFGWYTAHWAQWYSSHVAKQPQLCNVERFIIYPGTSKNGKTFSTVIAVLDGVEEVFGKIQEITSMIVEIERSASHTSAQLERK